MISCVEGDDKGVEMRRLILASGIALGALLVTAGSAAGSGETWSPATFDFGRQAVGTQSAPQTMTLTAGPSGFVPDPTIVNPSTGWDIPDQTCGLYSLTLGPGESCTVQVVFEPRWAGRQTSHLVGNDALRLPVAVLKGTGVSRSKAKCKRKGKRAAIAAKRCKKKPR
jgi:hypothetical protein